MTCRELAGFIADYLSGELPPQSRAEFERHLAVCPNCRTYLANYQAATHLARRALDEAAGGPRDAPDDLVQAILASRKR